MTASSPLALSEELGTCRSNSAPAWWVARGLIFGVLAFRVWYLFRASPWELLGDEAYYWEWSRRLDLCYYEKGPGLAYLIAASTRLFGISEGAVRLPMALLSAATAWGIGRLILATTGGNARAAMLGVVCFILLPAFQANAQICTQDGVIIALWVALSAAGLRLVRRWRDRGTRASDWVLVAVLLGIGFLFKQSVALFVASVVVYALIERRRLTWSPALMLQLLVAAGAFAAVVSPMVLWNATHHWPTLSHTLGHLGAVGGDRNASGERGFDIRWPLLLVGAQVGAFGPAAILLTFLATAWALRSRRTDPHRWPDRLWMLCCALPGIAFYLALSFRKPVLGNWPFPCFVTLVVLVGEQAASELGRGRSLLRTSWRVLVVYGAVGWAVICFPTVLGSIPLKSLKTAVTSRISGQRDQATRLQAAREEARARLGSDPILVTRYYMKAALYAFYLPDHPVVFNAGMYAGKRHTAYDYWPDTDLTAPALKGRDAVLDGGWSRPWDQVLRFDRIDALDGRGFSLGRNYQGPRGAAPREVQEDLP